MTPEEKSQLLEWGGRVSAATDGPWQPGCVVTALRGMPMVAGPWALHPVTLRGWLALDAARSPFLAGVMVEDVRERLAAICVAVDVLRKSEGGGLKAEVMMDSMSPEEVLAVEGVLWGHFSEVMEMALTMEEPQVEGMTRRSPDANVGGFGWVLPLYVRLREMGMSREEAMDTGMAEAFALRSCALWLRGWEVTGTRYAEREISRGDAEARREEEAATDRAEPERPGSQLPHAKVAKDAKEDVGKATGGRRKAENGEGLSNG